MLTLGIETATTWGSIGLCRGGEAVGELGYPATPRRAERLIPGIDHLLALTQTECDQLELIAVSLGPGSFTGLRVGLAAAKGLALARQVPLVGVPTLELYARRAPFWPGVVCPLVSDRRDRAYAAFYQGDRPQGPERILSAEELAEALRALKVPVLLIGPGASPMRRALGEAKGLPEGVRAHWASEVLNRPSGVQVAQAGYRRFRERGADDVDRLEPRYAQAPAIRPSGSSP